jgi:hypothetical protein
MLSRGESLRLRGDISGPNADSRKGVFSDLLEVLMTTVIKHACGYSDRFWIVPFFRKRVNSYENSTALLDAWRVGFES